MQLQATSVQATHRADRHSWAAARVSGTSTTLALTAPPSLLGPSLASHGAPVHRSVTVAPCSSHQDMPTRHRGAVVARKCAAVLMSGPSSVNKDEARPVCHQEQQHSSKCKVDEEGTRMGSGSPRVQGQPTRGRWQMTTARRNGRTTVHNSPRQKNSDPTQVNTTLHTQLAPIPLHQCRLHCRPLQPSAPACS